MKASTIAVLLIAAALPLSTYAQDANAQKSLQKAQFMLRQVSNEKAALQTEVETLKQQLEQLTREFAQTKSNAASAQQRTEEKYSSAIEQWKQRDGQVNAALVATKEQLKQQLVQRKELEVQLQKQTGNFSACYENNKKLYDINTELLSRYEQKGVGDVLQQKEPFTGIKRVEIENLVQDYRYQIDDLQVRLDQPSASAEGDAGKAAITQ